MGLATVPAVGAVPDFDSDAGESAESVVEQETPPKRATVREAARRRE